jgi:NitT/TauT family transport system permease protein
MEFKGIIAAHAWRTYWVTMAGFGLAIVVGVLLGFVIGSSRLAYAAVYPLMTGFNGSLKVSITLAFAGLVVVGAMAMVMYELFSVIERHTTGWAHRGSHSS